MLPTFSTLYNILITEKKFGYLDDRVSKGLSNFISAVWEKKALGEAQSPSQREIIIHICEKLINYNNLTKTDRIQTVDYVAGLLVGERPVVPDNTQANDLNREEIKVLSGAKKKLESDVKRLNQKKAQLKTTIKQLQGNNLELLNKSNDAQHLIERTGSLEKEISTLEKKEKSLSGKVKRLDVKKEKLNYSKN